MSETLKIGIVVPPLLKTPPTGYGGLEVVAYDLCVALAKTGHDVTLIAPKGSHAEGCKVIETIEVPRGPTLTGWNLRASISTSIRQCLTILISSTTIRGLHLVILPG